MNKYLFELDYSADSLRWIRKLEEKYPKFGSATIKPTYSLDDLENFQNEIIKDNDSALAYFFAGAYAYKQYKMQKLILDNKDAKYALLFAQNIKNCDIKALQALVVSSKKIKYICDFACFVSGADCKPLEEIIIKSKKIKYAHKFLKHVKGSDAKKFKNVILSSDKPRYLFELAKHLTDLKEISLIEDLIIKSGSFTYMRLFAEKIKTANIEKIEQAVLDSDNVNEIKKFAKYVKRSSMRKFFLVL
jgi:hypothetical protein